MVFPQGKLGGCTVISCGVTLNYTTYYLSLRKQQRERFVEMGENDQIFYQLYIVIAIYNTI